MHRTPRACLLLLALAAARAPAVLAGSSNSLMDISSDGALLACSNRDAGTVTILDLRRGAKLREIPGLTDIRTTVRPTKNNHVAVKRSRESGRPSRRSPPRALPPRSWVMSSSAVQ